MVQINPDTKEDLLNLKDVIEAGVGMPINAIRNYTVYDDGEIVGTFRIAEDVFSFTRFADGRFEAEPIEQDEEKTDSTRPYCLECVEKHLGAAMVLLNETDRGYPEHRLLVVGHLHEAEDEAQEYSFLLAEQIRQIRKIYQQTGEHPDFRKVYQLLEESQRIDSLEDFYRFDRGMPTAKAPCGRGWEGTKPGCTRAKGEGKKSKKESKSAKGKTPKPGSVAEIDPSAIAVDPKRFQYKIIGEHTATGEVGSLAGVKRYDPNLAGIVQVWKDPADGKTYVVNGHNRLALAKRLGADSVTVRYLDVKDAKEARAVGAITNIAEGRGTALDAAKFFKDTGLTKEDLDKRGIPMREKIAQDGLALSKLDDGLFRKVIDGNLPTERAVIIGGSGLNPTQQRDLYDLSEKQAKKGRKLTNEVLSELVDTVKGSEQTTETQFDLFGASEVQQTNAIERASLQASIKKRLSRDKKLFGIVGKSKAAQDLAKAGNVIDVESSSKVSQEASATLGLFDQLKNLRGGVSDAINRASTRIRDGESRKQVESDLYDEIKKAIKEESGK